MKSIKDLWFNLSDKFRFLLVGGFNFSVSYLLFVLAVLILGENLYQLSLALAWFISSFISFTTQRLLVFPIEGNLIKQYLKCCIAWFISYLINMFLLELLVKYIHANVFLSQIIATTAAAIFTYIAFKLFAFRGENNDH